MIIKSRKTLALFRVAGRCDFCGRACKRREAAHVFPKGMGGGSTLDVRINLAGLGLGAWAGAARECDCHFLTERGQIEWFSLLVKVANREGAMQRDLEAVLYLIGRLDNKASVFVIERAIDEELGNDAQREIARRTLKEHKRL